MPRGASSSRETVKCLFPKCRCPKGPRRQGKLWSECFPSVNSSRGLVAKKLCGDWCLKGALLLRKKNLGWRKSLSLQEKQRNWCMCFTSVDASRGLVAKGNYEVSVSQVSMPRGASSPRETMKCLFPKCRCPEGPRRQGKLCSECLLSDWWGPCHSGKKRVTIN